MFKNLNLEKCSENELKVIEVFQNYQNYIREDHYNGENEIFRFCGEVTRLFDKPIFTTDEIETKKNIEIIKDILESQEIKPYMMLIHNNQIHVDWASNGFQVVRGIEEYLEISLEFARYIDSIKCLDIKVETGIYYDDPNELEQVEFNKKSFGRDTDYYPEIQVFNHCTV